MDMEIFKGQIFISISGHYYLAVTTANLIYTFLLGATPVFMMSSLQSLLLKGAVKHLPFRAGIRRLINLESGPEPVPNYPWRHESLLYR